MLHLATHSSFGYLETYLQNEQFRVGYDLSTKMQLAFLSGNDWAPPVDWQDHRNWEPCPGSQKPSDLDGIELEEFALHLFNNPHVGCRGRFLEFISKGSNELVRHCRKLTIHLVSFFITSLRKWIKRYNKSALDPAIQSSLDIEMATTMAPNVTDLEEREDDHMQDCHLVFASVPKRCNVELRANGSLPFGWGMVLDEGLRAPVFAKAIFSALLTAVVIGIVIGCVVLARRCSWTVSYVIAIPSLLVAVATLIVQT